MGFTTGFIGGITLTSSVLYLSLAIHHRNRLHQALLLRQQSLVLSNIVEPAPPAPLPTSREVRGGLLETAKDRWNGELAGLVRRMQYMDWNAVRDGMEESVS
ncbi:hypothetical protein BJ546DRAFT_821338, partial [Cryomyces antarcticus]